MSNVDRYVSITDAKNRLPSLVRTLAAREDIVAITRDGAPAAVLLGIEQFEGLIETIEILSDAAAMRSLNRSRKQARGRRWVSHAAVFGRQHA